MESGSERKRRKTEPSEPSRDTVLDQEEIQQPELEPEPQTEEDQLDGVDRISKLPDGVIYHILSYLRASDTRRTAVLSTRWKKLFDKSPVLDIDEVDNLAGCYKLYQNECFCSRRCREIFLDALRLTIQNHDTNFLQKLKIRTAAHRDVEFDTIITRLLASAVTSKSNLDIEFIYFNRRTCRSSYFVVPEFLYSCGSCLVSLFLQGCTFNTFGPIDLPCLKVFTLNNVLVPDKMLTKLITGFPSIDTFGLVYCPEIQVLTIFSSSLKVLDVCCCSSLARLEIQAPSLHSMKIQGTNEVLDFGFSKIASLRNKAYSVTFCASLHNLRIHDVRLERQAFNAMLSTFPQVENITIEACTFLDDPVIICSTLKTLEFKECQIPGKMSVLAPRLENYSMVSNIVSRAIRFSYSDFLCKNLKVLSLEGATGLTDQLLQHLVSLLNFLESLHLKDCREFRQVRIISRTIKFLVVERCDYVVAGEIEAPQLLYFKYVGPIIDFSRIIAPEGLSIELHLSQKIKLRTIHCGSELRRLSDLISMFPNVKDIALSKFYKDFYSDEEVEILEQVSVSEMMKSKRQMRLKLNMERGVLVDVVCAVLGTPFCRESFLIDMETSAALLEFDEQQAHGLRQDCMRDHLVEVTMEGFVGNRKEMRLLTYLLSKMEKCKTVSISFRRNCSSLRRSQAMSRLMACPKACSNAEIVFSD